MRRAVLLPLVFASACAVLPQEPLPEDLAAWAEGGKDMVWRHTTADPPPPVLPLERFELCEDFGIAFFDSSRNRLFIEDGRGGFIDDDLLWAAGSLSEPPENADGGFVPSVEDPDLSPHRIEHGPCEIVFER